MALGGRLPVPLPARALPAPRQRSSPPAETRPAGLGCAGEQRKPGAVERGRAAGAGRPPNLDQARAKIVRSENRRAACIKAPEPRQAKRSAICNLRSHSNDACASFEPCAAPPSIS